MRKIIIGIFIVSLLLNCGVRRVKKPVYKNYYDKIFANYFNTELKNRPDTFLKHFQDPPVFYQEEYSFIDKSIYEIPCDYLLYQPYGTIFQHDLTSLTDMQPTYEYEITEDPINEYSIYDKPAFYSYLDSCKQVLSRDLDFRQELNIKPIFVFTTFEDTFDALRAYVNEKPQNRIKFIKKFYEYFYPNELLLMISDIDIIYKTNIKQIFKFRGNRAFVNKEELYKVLSNCFPDE